MAHGLLPLPIWGYVLVTLVLTHISIAAVTIYLHRHQAHRALDLHPVTAHFFRFWLWLTTATVTKQWVAVHRKHHALVETSEDPHSPQIHGVKKVLSQGWELYRDEARRQETLDDYGHGTPDDWLERNVYQRVSIGGVALMLVIEMALFGPIGITMWAVQMMWIPLLAAGVINGAGHYWGYRNYECTDASTNILPWGILIGGEELHNNHHAFASSAKLSSKWWELDIGWCYIRLLALCKLAKIKKVAPKPVVNEEKLKVDMDTVRAVITNRFHVMADYAKEVVGRVYEEELRKADASARNLIKPLRTLLTREDSLISEEVKECLRHLLPLTPTLEIVYEYKLQLQRLWQEQTATQEALLSALQDWCRQAEQTGIRALEDFAHSLRGYTLQPM
ncbi:MAG: DesA family fatty acid desaturase [Gammaproteobacteria bacterium]